MAKEIELKEKVTNLICYQSNHIFSLHYIYLDRKD